MASAASRPSRTPQTTSEAPRTMSPAANTPSMRRHHGLPVDPHRAPAGHLQLGLVEQRRQVLGIEAQRLDDQVGLDREARIRRPAPAAAGRSHRARPGACARRARAFTLVVAQEGLGRRLPDELDALLLGVAHLAHRARHVGAVAPVEAAAPRRRPGAPRCARSPSRCRRRRSPRPACRRHPARRSRTPARRRPGPCGCTRSGSRAPARCCRGRRRACAMSRAW